MSFAQAKLTYYTLGDERPLLFHGINSTEAEEFIYMTHSRALASGKVRDNAWIADLAGSCFVGGALRWYDSLSEEVRGRLGPPATGAPGQVPPTRQHNYTRVRVRWFMSRAIDTD